MDNFKMTLCDFFLVDESVSEDQKSFIKKEVHTEKLQTILEKEDDSIEWSFFMDEVSQKIVELLDIRIGNIVLDAWSVQNIFHAYLSDKNYTADKTIFESLLTHKIESKYKPIIEITLNNRVIHTMHLGIDFELKLEGVIVVIKNKKIQRIKTGKCEASGILKYENIIITREELKAINIPGEIILGKEEGILK